MTEYALSDPQEAWCDKDTCLCSEKKFCSSFWWHPWILLSINASGRLGYKCRWFLIATPTCTIHFLKTNWRHFGVFVQIGTNSSADVNSLGNYLHEDWIGAFPSTDSTQLITKSDFISNTLEDTGLQKTCTPDNIVFHTEYFATPEDVPPGLRFTAMHHIQYMGADVSRKSLFPLENKYVCDGSVNLYTRPLHITNKWSFMLDSFFKYYVNFRSSRMKKNMSFFFAVAGSNYNRSCWGVSPRYIPWRDRIFWGSAQWCQGTLL